MALTVVSAPANRLHLSGEPCIAELQCSDYITAGNKAMRAIGITGICTVGQILSITCMGIQIDLVARINPEYDGRDWIVGANTADQAAKAIAALQANYSINQWYAITNPATGIVMIEARIRGSIFNFTIAENMSNLAEVSAGTYAPVTGTDNQYPDFHKVHLRLYGRNAGDLPAGGLPDMETAFPPDANGRVRINLKQTAMSFITRQIRWPENQAITARPLHIAEITVAMAEMKGTPPVPASEIVTLQRWFAPGGISFERISALNEEGLTTFPAMAAGAFQELPFLTWQPDRKKVFFEQVEKLYYFFYHAYEQIRLYYTITKKDGTVLLKKLRSIFKPTAGYNCIEVIVSPYTMNLTNWANLGDIASYAIHLEDGQGNRISEYRTFVIRHEYHRLKRQFVWENSRGGFDTILCTGQQSEDIEHTREEFVTVLTDLHTSHDAETNLLKVTEQRTFSLSTGWITDATNNWLRDFALSKLAWTIDKQGRKVRVNLVSQKIFKRTDNDFLYKMDFDYVYAFEDEYYSPVDAPVWPSGVMPVPKYVYQGNQPPVVGLIMTDSNDYTNHTLNGIPLQAGARVLIIDPTTFEGDVNTHIPGDPATWVRADDNQPGNRILNQDDGRIYICNMDLRWMATAVITNFQLIDGKVVITGYAPDNTRLAFWIAELEAGPYIKAGESDDITFNESGAVVTVAGERYLKILVSHSLYTYPESETIRFI